MRDDECARAARDQLIDALHRHDLPNDSVRVRKYLLFCRRCGCRAGEHL